MAGRLAYGVWYVFSAGRAVSAAHRKNGCEVFAGKSECSVFACKKSGRRVIRDFFAVAEYVPLVRSLSKRWIKAACDSFFYIRRVGMPVHCFRRNFCGYEFLPVWFFLCGAVEIFGVKICPGKNQRFLVS